MRFPTKPTKEWKPPGPKAPASAGKWAANWPRQNADGSLHNFNWGKPLPKEKAK